MGLSLFLLVAVVAEETKHINSYHRYEILVAWLVSIFWLVLYMGCVYVWCLD